MKRTKVHAFCMYILTYYINLIKHKHMKTKLQSSRLMSIISLLILCLYANSAWATNVSKADIDGAIGINVATQKMDVSGSIADKMPIPVGDVHKPMTADLMFGKQALKTNLQQTGGKTRSISLDGKVATPRKAPTKTAVNVSGLIDASTLADNAEIVLTGNTNLFMNVNKTLKCISGDYTLTISGGNILTINNPNGAGIEVKSLNSTAPLNITVRDNAIATTNAAGDVTINGNLTAETTGDKYFCIVGKKVTLIGGTMTITSVTNAVVSYGDMILGGDITASVTDDHSGAFNTRDGGNLLIQEGSTINALSAGFGIYAAGNITMPNGSLTARGYSNATVQCNSGNISLTGTINVKGKDCAICAGDEKDVGDVTINGDLTAETTGNKYYCIVGKKVTLIGGTMTITSVTNAVVSYGDMILGGDITASVTDDHSGAFNTRDGGNLLIQEGSTINALSAGFGIYAAGNITMPNGSLTARGYSNATVQCNSGNISLTGTINVKGKDCAICAGDENVVGDVTINGDLTAETTGNKYFCIVGKKVTLIGGTMKITSVTNAVVSYGDITLSGEITAVSSMKNSVAINSRDDGNIIVKNGKIIAKGGDIGIYATGSINLTPPLVVITAAGGGISDDGHTVVYDNGKVATRVVIMDPPIAGVVALNSTPAPGNSVGFTVSGDFATSETSNVWQISDDNVTWQDIVENASAMTAPIQGEYKQQRVATSITYTPKESEIGKYIRVKVSASDYSGYIYSPSRQIAKLLCTNAPAEPVLTNINDKVNLSNAKTTQEYIIFNYPKEASSLTPNDWNNAITPDSEVGFFELNSTTNANHTVFTRIKETTSTLASENVAEARLYIGTSVYLTDIELNITKTVGYFQKINNELNCKVGDVIRCDASPVPSDATNWYGISGSNWTVDNRNTGSAYGTFYEDADCTVPINTSTNYKTVYLKTLTEKNYLEVRILYYNSGIGYKSRAKEFNVTPDGYFPLLDYINGCSRTIAAGEKITGIEVSRRPFSGSVYGLTTEVSGEGIAPVVSFSLYETMTINAINATPGVYVYTPLQNGHPLNNNTTFTITVTDGKYGVDSLLLRENAITADPDEVLELVAQLMPANSEAEITWTSSNTSVATVQNGIVTIAENAPIGAMATITANANGKSDKCEITVSGEEYDLYVASTRVTSRNQDNILGDGNFSFDGMNTLTIKGDYTINNSANLVRNTGIDGLYINIAQACTISQGEESYSTLFDLRKNTAIHGEQMTVNGNGIAFSAQGGMTLTLDSANLVVSAIMPFKGSGIDEDNMNIMNSHVEVNASGSAAIFSFAGGISLTDCHIQIPTNAVVMNGTIEDGNGSQVRNLLIVPNPVKTESALAFASSEATAIVGETFTAPILSNPNNLTITYYSEEPMIAKVDAQTGEVTPMAAGTTIITAYTDGNLYHKAGEVSYTLIVLKGSVSLSFTQNTVSVRVDDEEFVLPTLNNPQDVSVTYSSTNPAVATVLALTGDVTLVAAGTTTITATFLGDKSYNEASASYDLIVTESTATDLNYISTQPNASSVQKILLSGQLLILRDGKTYNIMGQEL